MKRTANVGIGIVLFLGLAGISASAQSEAPSNPPQGPSLGDYARQVRKGPEAKAKARVFDNDNLPTQDKLSVVGTASTTTESAPEQKPPDAGGTSSAAGADAKPGAANPPSDTSKMDQAGKEAAWKQWADKIKAQQDAIDLATRELDVVQREYQIRAAAMYADAGNRLRNSGDWDKQDAQYKQQIADKQKAVDNAKQKLEDLQEEARKAGVPSSVREP